ncbi:TadE/TadG family type IV pilus assembly protein [Gorillibacterium timonense]|uniref:TadE/TadG family type IV pilus assembly protein n=1 Tax=Gorillibacterium timonense TaxID=1689269 RepID=UPI00071DCF8A|nr:hypothetical protein [Gorillibacterium timonense]
MTLEAALILPFFLLFVLGLHVLIRLSVTEAKVQAAASESVKEIATHYAPVDRLYLKAKQAAGNTKTAEVLTSVIDQIKAARQAAIEAENSAQSYASLIPEPIVQLLEWEQKRRQQLEASGQETVDQVVETCIDPVLNAAFQPVVWHYADERVLRKDHFRITKVTIPDLNASGEPWFGVEVEYQYRLPVPFVKKTVTVKKKAMERAWVGKR